MAAFIEHLPTALSFTDLTYNAAQSTITRLANTNTRLFRTIDKLHSVLTGLDIASLLWNGATLVMETERKYAISAFLHAYGGTYTPYYAAAALIATAVFLGLLVHAINAITKPSQELPKKATWQKPDKEFFRQFFCMAKLVENVAIISLFANLSRQVLFSALNAGFQAYTLGQLSTRRWFECKRTYDIVEGDIANYASEVTVSYHSYLHSATSGVDEECTICLENEPDVNFCDNHKFHTRCIVEHAATRMKQIIQKVEPREREVVTRRDNYGTSRKAIYKIEVPQESLPGCPNCRGRPGYNELSIKYKDKTYGLASTQITWT